MKKEQINKIAKWSTIVLIVPVLGQLFVDGWNWGLGDFIFAWVFFNVLGLTYTFVTNKITHSTARVMLGLLIIALFASIWVILATG